MGKMLGYAAGGAIAVAIVVFGIKMREAPSGPALPTVESDLPAPIGLTVPGDDSSKIPDSAVGGFTEATEAREPLPVQAEPIRVPLRPEFESLINGGAPSGLTRRAHARLREEPRDPYWAPDMESRWNEYYAGKPELLRYGVPEVECGSTVCEIRLLAYGTDGSEDWTTLMFGSGVMDPARIPFGNARGTAAPILNGKRENNVTAITLHFTYHKHDI